MANAQTHEMVASLYTDSECPVVVSIRRIYTTSAKAVNLQNVKQQHGCREDILI